MFAFHSKLSIRLVALANLALIIFSAITSQLIQAQDEGAYMLYPPLMGVSDMNTPPPPPPPLEGGL